MVKKRVLRFFTSLRRRRGLRLARFIKHLRAGWMPVHPCTGHRLARSAVFHQPADTCPRPGIKAAIRITSLGW